MTVASNCLLCGSKARPFHHTQDREWLACTVCEAIFVDPLYHPSATDEKAIYQLHNNDVTDSGYQRFVSPITEAVQADFDSTAVGLDFGCGEGPVISHVLARQGYKLSLYDPFFHAEPTALDRQYDFIVCCEVVEHFANPAAEFQRLFNLLRPGGHLYCMTRMWQGDDFSRWHYKNDPTHIFFYTLRSIAFIQKQFGFDSMTHDDRLIVFKR